MRKTSTFTSSDGYFKPGIDFYSSGANQGQALMLQNFAATHNVTMIQLSIGGNNFNFADIIQTLRHQLPHVAVVVAELLQRRQFGDGQLHHRQRDSADQRDPRRHQQHQDRDGQRRLQPPASTRSCSRPTRRRCRTAPAFRYSQSGFTRQSTGGCGFWNNDANWANSTALVKINNAVKSAAASAGVKVLDLAAAFNGRRLCENTVNLMENSGKANWTVAGASDTTEWIAQIRTLSTVFGPYYVQESLHPNWWGEKAIRNCVRQAYNGGAVEAASAPAAPASTPTANPT